MLNSTMQDVPLQIRRILEHGTSVHGTSQVSTALPGGYRHSTYAQVGRNAARLAHALRDLGIRRGDRVATFMWNNQEHLEAYYAVPCLGAVLHPLNIRLAPEQIIYTANHALDRVVIVDASLLATFAAILPALRSVAHVIVNGAVDHAILEPPSVMAHDYQQVIRNWPDSYPWPDADERQPAAMCYTSGTTGDPKGVVYSHRSIYLHALGLALPDAFNLSARDRVLAVVPQFHVLAWGVPYAAFLTGASLAMPDAGLGPRPLAEFIEGARPNKAAGVPTVWRSLLEHADADPLVDLSSLQEMLVGGSACPEALMAAYQQRHGITLVQAWGMTEMSPLGTVARPPAGVDPASAWRYRLTQGRFAAPVEARLVGPAGTILPHDGTSPGELEVRGPWVTGRYHADDDPDRFHDGWLRTGDVGTISPDGFLTLTDRAKDVIKSGGEWISSVELENHLMGHPAVAEAAVIGVPDEQWGERPLAVVALKAGHDASSAELRGFLGERLPRWQLPERWSFIEEVPKTSVGKFDKKTLRARHARAELQVHLLSPEAERS
jgi:fatty-acyl-CoA synthase